MYVINSFRFFQTGSGVKRSSDTDSGSNDKSAKVCKYGNFVSSSGCEQVEDKKMGFILAPKKLSQPQKPSENIMTFCDNIVQHSQQDRDSDTNHTYIPEYQRQLDQHRRNSENQNKTPQLNLDWSYPLHNFIIVILDYATEEPPTQVLQRSAGFCKMPVTWQYKDTSVCYITIDNHVRFPPSHYP